MDNPDPKSVCGEIAGEVRDIAIALFFGQLDPDTFEKAVMALESAKLKRFGFHLAAERLPNGGSRFRLSSVATGDVCATFDFDTGTNKLEVQHIGG